MSSEYDELIGKLDGLKTTTRKKALRKGLRAMGKVMQAAIIAAAVMSQLDFNTAKDAMTVKAQHAICW